MKTPYIIAAFFVLLPAVFLAGCGAGCSKQLKEAQDARIKADARANEADKQVASLRASLDRCAKELEQAKYDVQFFARKVNPLELENYQKEQRIESLMKELEACRKAAGQNDSNSPAASQQAPAEELLQ